MKATKTAITALAGTTKRKEDRTMKKRNILWAAAAVLLAACSQEEPAATTSDSRKYVQMTFTANAPAGTTETRTSLVDGSKVYWESGDKIGVYSCMTYNNDGIGECSPFTTDIQNSSATATFTGTAEEGALKYIAVYPQERFSGGMCPDENTMKLNFELPTEQKAVPNGFESGLAPSLAITNDRNGTLTFRNLGMLVKFRISGDIQGLKSVTLADTKNIGLTETCGYTIAPDGDNTREEFSASAPSVTLTTEDSFSNGNDYYFVIMPAAYIKMMNIFVYALKDGFSLTFTREDGTSFTKTSSGIGKSLVAGTILDLGTIDLAGAIWQ